VIARWHGHPLTTDLGRGTHALIEGALALAENRIEAATSSADRATKMFRGCRAPWWVWKALRALESAGGATPDLVREADEIGQALGVAKGVRGANG